MGVRRASGEGLTGEVARRYRVWYRWRGWLVVPAFCVMVFCTWNEWEKDVVLFTVGPVIFALGVAMRVWAQMHLRYRLKVKKHLTTTGPYRYVRNPVYIGNTLVLVGLCWMSELVWLIPLVVLNCAIVYSLAVRYEEAHLTGKYGEAYLAYLHRVPRWVPRLSPAEVPPSLNSRRFLGPSLQVEAVALLYLAFPIVKEIFKHL